MSEPADSDPERLLAEALRAQARSAPAPSQPEATGGPTDVLGGSGDSRQADARQADDGLPHGYGLLSGTGANSLERERAALDSLPAAARAPTGAAGSVEPETGGHDATDSGTPPPLAARWILLLAVVLGLAAGAVVGLLTLL